MKPKLRQIGPFIQELFWEEKPNDFLLKNILSWEIAVSSNFGSEVLEIRKGFQTLSCYLKKEIKESDIKAWQRFIQSNISLSELPDKLWEIPVCYDPELGKDLISLSKSKSIDPQQLIALHSSPIYRIHFFGFLPGFMYLNGLDPVLHFPRKNIPDQRIESGSVAIGGSQTGIYPTESPGGWHVIGKTPIQLFKQDQIPPVFAKPGDQIKFVPISKEEYFHSSKLLKNDA